VSTLNTAVKNCEGIERSYIQYGTSCKQWKSLKYYWRKWNQLLLHGTRKHVQALSVEGSIIRDKAFIIIACLRGDNFTGSDGLIKS